jgi:hypothetical protein
MKTISFQLANTYFIVFSQSRYFVYGIHFLHRSMNQGQTWTAISPDLTNGTKEGNVFGTIATISESQLQFGLLYTGSDDGLIYVSKDMVSWNKISTNLPQNLWVSRVTASTIKGARICYLKRIPK